MNLTIFCMPKLDNFIEDISKTLSKKYNVKKSVSYELKDHLYHLRSTDIVWLEWGNQLSAAITKHASSILSKKRVILRIHSYEVLDDLIHDIDYTHIDDIIFVAPHIKDIFFKEIKVAIHSRIHILPNCIDTKTFNENAKSKSTSKGIAMLATLNFKKDPMVALQAYLEYVKQGGTEDLHIAGGFQQKRYKFAFENFIQKNSLTSRIFLYDWIHNVNDWLSNKKFILCTSLMEGHPVGLLEAMSMGLYPLIYSWPGAEDIYPDAMLWSSISEFKSKLLHLQTEHSLPNFRQYIMDSFSEECLETYLDLIFSSDSGVDIFELCIKPTKHLYSPKSYYIQLVDDPSSTLVVDSENKTNRALDIYFKLKEHGHTRLALDVLKEAALSTTFSNLKIIDTLYTLAVSLKDIETIKWVLISYAREQALKNNLNTTLGILYKYVYAYKSLLGEYDSAPINQEVYFIIQHLISQQPQHRDVANTIRKKPSNQVKRVAFFIEGLSWSQAPIALIRNLLKNYPKEKYSIFVYSRFGLDAPQAQKENYHKSHQEFTQHVTLLRCMPTGLNPDLEINTYLSWLQKDSIDIAIFQTIYFVPQYAYLAFLKPVKKHGYISMQQAEYPKGLDFAFSTYKNIGESVTYHFDFPLLFIDKKQPPIDICQTFPFIPPGAFVSVSAGRKDKFGSLDFFWRTMKRVLLSNENLYHLFIGPDQLKDICNDDYILNSKRVFAVGYREDLQGIYKSASLYVDPIPYTSGLANIEAISLSLPMLSTYSNVPTLEIGKNAGNIFSPQSITNIDIDNISQWINMFNQLIADRAFYLKAKEFSLNSKGRFELAYVQRNFFNALDQILV